MASVIELYLIRHGVAADRGDDYPDDAKRPLTSQGVTRLRKEGRGLAELEVSFDVILTSPLVRAKQTAETLAATFSSRPAVAVTDALAPGGTYNAFIDELARHDRLRRIAAVGHEPGIGELASRLLGAKKAVEFRKGAVCRIDLATLPPTGPGTLRWFLTSKMLRFIGK